MERLFYEGNPSWENDNDGLACELYPMTFNTSSNQKAREDEAEEFWASGNYRSSPLLFEDEEDAPNHLPATSTSSSKTYFEEYELTHKADSLETFEKMDTDASINREVGKLTFKGTNYFRRSLSTYTTFFIQQKINIVIVKFSAFLSHFDIFVCKMSQKIWKKTFCKFIQF